MTQPGYESAREAEANAERFHIYADFTLLSDDTGTKGGHVGEQLNLNPEYDFRPYGRVGFITWLEFFDAPCQTEDENSVACLESDFGPYWGYDIDAIQTSIQLGWLGETFPRSHGDEGFTQEYYIALYFDDSKLFKQTRPVFNPYAAYYQDVDDNPGGHLDLGISHDFFLGEVPALKDVPILRDCILTPSLLAGIDIGQFDRHGHLDTLRYGLDLSYDMTPVLKLSPTIGRVFLTGFIYYQESFAKEYEDQLYGGISISFAR